MLEHMSINWKRCFIALSPDSITRSRLAALPLAPGPRRVAAADLHLTLAFLGAVAPEQVNGLHQLIVTCARSLPPLAPLTLQCWPSETRPRVAVLGFELPGELLQLVEQVQQGLVTLGFRTETRAFRPHVTLARFKRHAAPYQLSSISSPGWHASFNAIGLYSSTVVPDQNAHSAKSLASRLPIQPKALHNVTQQDGERVVESTGQLHDDGCRYRAICVEPL